MKKGSYESGEGKASRPHSEGVPGRKSFPERESTGDLCLCLQLSMSHCMHVRKIPSAGKRPTQKEKRK